MAKTSQIYRDRKRIALIAKHSDQRAQLRKQLKDANLPLEEKAVAQAKLDKLPHNSCPTRFTRRCALTGRSRAVYRKFGISRIMLRKLALEGKIPGMTKSSW